MDLANLSIIRSSDSKIPVAEKPIEPELAQQAKIINISIDEKFIDKATIANPKELQATVLAKLDNGKFLLELDNGKQIELKLPTDLKVMDKVFLQLENSQVTNVQVKDIAQSLNLDNKALVNLISLLQQQSGKQNIIPLLIDQLTTASSGLNQPQIQPQTQQQIKLPLANNLLNFLNIIPKQNSAPIQQNQQPQLNLNNQTIQQTTGEIPIAKVEFPALAIKSLVSILQNNKQPQSFDVKVTQQPAPQQVQVSLNKNLSAELTFAKAEQMLNNQITLSPKVLPKTENFALVKADTNNIIQNIKLTPDNLKQIIEPLKLQIIPKQNTQVQSFTANIENNKVSLPTLNNLTFKLPVKTEQLFPQSQSNQPIKAEVQIIQHNNKPELILKTAGNPPVKLDNVELELNNKQVNTIINTSLQQGTITSSSNNAITIKSADFFQIILNVKNNLTDTKNLSFNLDTDSKIHLLYPDKTLENPIAQAKSTIAQEALPHLAKQFAPQLSFMLATALVSNKITQQTDEKSDIFSLLLDTMPDQYKPKLQVSSQQNDGWKFFSFPYLQEDNQTKYGQALYSNQKDENDNQHSSLAIKVSFSNIGDVMLKFKILNKNIQLNIYTQIDIKPAEKQNLTKIAQQAIDNSGFYGTVAIKKQKTIEIPLLNSDEIVYSNSSVNISI